MPDKTKTDKLLYLSYYFPPSGGPGVQRTLKFVKYFPQFGVEPYVVTIREKSASYPIIDKSLLKEIPKSTEVYRTKSFEPLRFYRLFTKKKEIPYSGFVNMDKGTAYQKISRFIRGNFFMPDARVGWKKYAYKQSRKLIEQEDFKAIVTTSPPHSSQLAGLRIKQKLGLKWIADLRDPWTDIYYYNDFYQLPWVRKKDARYEREVLENADRIIVVSESMKTLFAAKSDKIDPDKIYVIPNGFDEEDFADEKPGKTTDFVISYVGTMADQYPIDSFIGALSKIRKAHPDVQIKWRVVGRLSETIKEKIKAHDLKNIVELLGHKSHKVAVKQMLSSDALLLVIPKMKNNEGILTGKLFEYLAARKPIILLGPQYGDASKIVAECKSGRNFEYKDGLRLYAYLDEMIKTWKSKKNLDIKNTIYKKFERKQLTHDFARIIKDL